MMARAPCRRWLRWPRWSLLRMGHVDTVAALATKTLGFGLDP
jgi:hypothetical protein